jgi:hypothetical protein
MDRIEAFLHVVDRNEIVDAGKTVQQIVFEPKDWSWPHDCCLGVDLSSNLFAHCLVHTGQQPDSSSTCWLLTFVRKNSEGEFESALYDDS